MYTVTVISCQHKVHWPIARLGSDVGAMGAHSSPWYPRDPIQSRNRILKIRMSLVLLLRTLPIWSCLPLLRSRLVLLLLRSCLPLLLWRGLPLLLLNSRTLLLLLLLNSRTLLLLSFRTLLLLSFRTLLLLRSRLTLLGLRIRLAFLLRAWLPL